MDVMHVVGNRPQFIKLSPVSRELRKRGIQEVIIHTGQHYDVNLSRIFFEELDIPEPARNLDVGSGSHAQVTGSAMIRIEKSIEEFAPKCVVVYGDTNSTLAAALVAAKLCIPLIHVEAGPRTYNKTNPEECNRIVVDHISDYLCAPDRISAGNLIKEGIAKDKIFFTGDVMYDEFLYCLSQGRDNPSLYSDGYILMTWHRQENTCSRERMEKIIYFIEKINYNIILPLHPRTKKFLEMYALEERINKIPYLKIIEPVGYKEMTVLLNNCKLLVSDSGGASKEASFVGKKCIYMLDLNIWPELVENDYIQLMDIDNNEMVEKSLYEIKDILATGKGLCRSEFFGNGNAAGKIVDVIEKIV